MATMRTDNPPDADASASDPARPVWMLGILLGVALPVLTAFLYPTYFTMMVRPSVEQTRILELPYVAFEVLFILWAGRKGFDLSRSIRSVPGDVRIAGGIAVAAMFASSVFISKDVTSSLTHSLIWVVHLIFALAVLSIFSRAKVRSGHRFMHWHIIGLVVLAIYTAFWFSTVPPLNELPFNEVRLRGAVPGWIDVRHFGSWTGAIAAAFAVHLLYRSQKSASWWATSGYLLAAGLTVWTGTRAAILAIIVVTAMFVMIHGRLPHWRRIAMAALLTGVACLLAIALLPDDPVFRLFSAEELRSGSKMTRTRWLMWGRAAELWLRSPWLGLGTGSIFWEYSPGFAPFIFPTQPHNVVLQFLMSWGLIGTLPALWVLLRIIRAVHRAGRDTPELHIFMAMLYALLFQSLLEGMLHYPRFIVSIIVLSALMYTAGSKREPAHRAAV